MDMKPQKPEGRDQNGIEAEKREDRNRSMRGKLPLSSVMRSARWSALGRDISQYSHAMMGWQNGREGRDVVGENAGTLS